MTRPTALSTKANSLASSPSLPQSSSPRLPEEIVSEVLDLAWDEGNPNSLLDLQLLRTSGPVTASLSTTVLQPKALQGFSMRTRQLCNYALVCRTWSDASLPLLYSHILLLSPKQVQLFARTLKSSPMLAQMAKEISIIIPAASLKLKLLRWLRLQAQDVPLGESTPSGVYSFAAFIVSSCQNLKALHLCMPERRLTSPGLGIFTPGVSGGGLRELIIHGHAMSNVTSTSVLPPFPLLEVLCFHRTVAGAQFTLPRLPRLHTLRFIEAFMWCSSVDAGPQILVPGNLPVLHSLAFHGTSFTAESFRSQVSEFFPYLRTLSVATSQDVLAFRILTTSNALKNLEHLTIGQLHVPDHPLASWRIPPSLKSLTLLVNVTARESITGMQCFSQFLQLNEQTLSSGLCSLQQALVCVYCPPNETPLYTYLVATCLVMIGYRIISLCVKLKIRLKARIIDIGHWYLHAQTRKLQNEEIPPGLTSPNPHYPNLIQAAMHEAFKFLELVRESTV